MYEIYITGATSDAAAKVELRAGAAGGAEPAVVPEFDLRVFQAPSGADMRAWRE